MLRGVCRCWVTQYYQSIRPEDAFIGGDDFANNRHNYFLAIFWGMLVSAHDRWSDGSTTRAGLTC
jgi:hypothetical protein